MQDDGADTSHGKPSSSRRLSIGFDLAEVSRAIEAFEAFAETENLPVKVVQRIGVVLDELLNNVISYGSPPDESRAVEVLLERFVDRLVLTVTDGGPPFDPLARPAPDTSAPSAEREVGGLGIHLVRNLVDNIRYARKADSNILTVTQSLPQPTEPI
jgi:anti-sigma regulatory factor (Ser/Thr protein kinase)